MIDRLIFLLKVSKGFRTWILLMFFYLLYTVSVRVTTIKNWTSKNLQFAKVHVELLNKPIYINLRIQDIAIFFEIFQEQSYALPRFNCQSVLDLGGHIGLFTLYMKLQYSPSKIVVFEPDNENYKLLSLNTKMCKGITTINAAVSNFQGVSGWNRSGFAHNYGISENPSGETQVNVQRISDVIREHFSDEVIDVVKIDIEGEETNIFNDTNLNWTKSVKNILVETHGANSDKALKNFISRTDLELKARVKSLYHVSSA